MSDSYEIDGVTLTPTGGGWYELAHVSIPDGEKIQGKEHADARAKIIAGAATLSDDGGSLPPQPPIDVAPPPEVASNSEVAALKAALAAKDAQIAKLEAAKVEGGTKTVVSDGGAVPPVFNQAAAPTVYDGVLDDKRKAELKRLGIETTRIVLEENETIPPTGLFIGHNGRGYNIVPGEEVDVPNFLLGVLDDAIMSAPITDSKSQKVLGYRNRSKYPYRVVK